MGPSPLVDVLSARIPANTAQATLLSGRGILFPNRGVLSTRSKIPRPSANGASSGTPMEADRETPPPMSTEQNTLISGSFSGPVAVEPPDPTPMTPGPTIPEPPTPIPDPGPGPKPSPGPLPGTPSITPREVPNHPGQTPQPAKEHPADPTPQQPTG